MTYATIVYSPEDSGYFARFWDSESGEPVKSPLGENAVYATHRACEAAAAHHVGWDHVTSDT